MLDRVRLCASPGWDDRGRMLVYTINTTHQRQSSPDESTKILRFFIIIIEVRVILVADTIPCIRAGREAFASSTPIDRKLPSIPGIYMSMTSAVSS